MKTHCRLWKLGLISRNNRSYVSKEKIVTNLTLHFCRGFLLISDISKT